MAAAAVVVAMAVIVIQNKFIRAIGLVLFCAFNWYVCALVCILRGRFLLAATHNTTSCCRITCSLLETMNEFSLYTKSHEMSLCERVYSLRWVSLRIHDTFSLLQWTQGPQTNKEVSEWVSEWVSLQVHQCTFNIYACMTKQCMVLAQSLCTRWHTHTHTPIHPTKLRSLK